MLGFRVLEFRVLEFRVLGFRVNPKLKSSNAMAMSQASHDMTASRIASIIGS